MWEYLFITSLSSQCKRFGSVAFFSHVYPTMEVSSMMKPLLHNPFSLSLPPFIFLASPCLLSGFYVYQWR